MIVVWLLVQNSNGSVCACFAGSPVMSDWNADLTLFLSFGDKCEVTQKIAGACSESLFSCTVAKAGLYASAICGTVVYPSIVLSTTKQ